MDEIRDFFFLFLAQFSGGPGPPENNLVRFGLAAIFWGILLYGAWSRQRNADLPREKLLVFGFGLGFLREIFMLGRASLRILAPVRFQAASLVMEPIEHALVLASMVVIAGSFLRYILDDAPLARRFLRTGLGLTAVGYLIALIWWPRQMSRQMALRFSESGPSWLMHLMAALILAAAIVILLNKKAGWLRNVVIVALSLFLLSEILAVGHLSPSTNRTNTLCPLSNALYIWTIPLFGYIYFREQSWEKKKAEEALADYRSHLEELVESRTKELVQANKKLERAVVLEERQRIAAEMHDGLAQTLTYLGMKMDGANEQLQNGQAAQVLNEFNQMQDAIDQAIMDVRRSIASLQETPQPRQSLQVVLGELIEERNRSGETAVQLINHLPQPCFLSPHEMEQIKPLVSEAIYNAQRHAHAAAIMVSVDTAVSDLQISISDNGQGFNIQDRAALSGDHFGLSIMEARAVRMNGRLAINSQPGQGTEIILTWQPRQPRSQIDVQEAIA